MSRNHPLAARRGAAVSVIVAAALVTAACTGTAETPSGTDPDSAPTIGGTLQLANTNPGAFSHFNPWGTGYGINNSLFLSEALYDSLVHLDEDGEPTPSLATSWTAEGDNVTLQLREGVEFADGTPLDAAAVKANLDYALANPTGAECNIRLEGINVTAPDPATVSITLPHPMPDLLKNFGQCAGFIVNPAALADPDLLTKDAAGTGPYTVNLAETSIAQSRFVFDRNSDYWNDEGAARFEKIVVTAYESRTAALNAVRGGQADLLANQPLKEVESLGVDVKPTVPQLLQGAWFSDTTGDIVEALGDERVRQALNYAIDREAIGKAIYGEELEITASTPFPSFYGGWTEEATEFYPYDPDKAKELLAEAGYGDGLSIPVLTSPLGQQMAEALAGYLAEVGVQLELGVHASDYISEAKSGRWPMIVANYTLNSAQLQSVMGVVGPNGYWNPRHNSDPEVEELLAEIEGTPETEADKVESLYAELSTLIAEKALLLTPVIISTGTVYNGDKVEVDALVKGLPGPMLYDISSAE